MPQTNTIDFLEFPAKDVEALAEAKAFYAGVFGWKFKDWGDDYSDTQSSGLGSGFNADPAHRPSAPLAVIYSDDLESVYFSVKSAGGKISREIFEFPGGRRFHFFDPAGNELAVWSDR